MNNANICRSIAERTGGDIYIAVVGPVRVGKSTFIKRFMEELVIPDMGDTLQRERARDELPQSGDGKTIMTTEPKFVPEEAAQIKLPDGEQARVRLIDCVGYIVDAALGYMEEGIPRQVTTPWSDEPMPFAKAAELGTKKVISDHSTIGVLVTTDGSVTELSRADYEDAEKRVAAELELHGKPYVVVLNTKNPRSDGAKGLSEAIYRQYGVPVIPVNCMEMSAADIMEILATILREFPVRETGLDIPAWILALSGDHPVRRKMIDGVRTAFSKVRRVRELADAAAELKNIDIVEGVYQDSVDLGNGVSKFNVAVNNKVFYEVLSEISGMDLSREELIFAAMRDFSKVKARCDKLSDALSDADMYGYGIVAPSIEEMSLEEPEIVRQGNRFGVKLKASATSVHLIKASINTEISPIVGSESQSEELLKYLMTGFEEDPKSIWSTEIFGKSLNELVNEGLQSKLSRMPAEVRSKVRGTLERVINEGSNGLICIIL